MKPHGPFVWHELLVPNPAASHAFYKNVIGWGTQPVEGMGYTLWMNGQARVAGLMELPKDLAAMGVPPHWLHYIGVRDVDATAKLAQELGGRINMPPTDIPNIGRFAVIADPQGAVFAIFSSIDDRGGPVAPTIGEFSWHELATTDREAAFAFYSRLFDWKETSSMDMGEGMSYQMFGLGGEHPIGGMYKISKEMKGMPPNWLGYVMVKSLDDTVAAVKNNGGQVLNGPIDIPGGRVAVFSDPQGAAFAAHESTVG